MSEGGARARVGVRELRQNLSVYLRRVEKGEILDVTEHGRLVAQLAPVPSPAISILDRLIAEGRATPAKRTIASLPPPRKPEPGAPILSEVIRQMREDERW